MLLVCLKTVAVSFHASYIVVCLSNPSRASSRACIASSKRVSCLALRYNNMSELNANKGHFFIAEGLIAKDHFFHLGETERGSDGIKVKEEQHSQRQR